MLAYLCGPIEFAPDGGKLWRQKLIPFLHNDVGHRVYDPAADEKKNLTDEEIGSFRAWMQNDIESFREKGGFLLGGRSCLPREPRDVVLCDGIISGDNAKWIS